ncbi:MAG: hypothetical protein Q3979_04090 [Actinomycetaceae bacterium]|nr:hypothetical protein [Actinomycetaceae bacterium]
MMDIDPELAYEHAQAAYRHAARIDIVREALGLSAYLTGRYSQALRELRTYRRMTDDYSHVAIEADSERGLGRPGKALTFISEIPLKRLDPEARIELALVTSGARADSGDSEGGLAVLQKIKAENLDDQLRARIELIRADRYDELGRGEEAAALRATWEPVFAEEGEVDVYEYDDSDEDGEGAESPEGTAAFGDADEAEVQDETATGDDRSHADSSDIDQAAAAGEVFGGDASVDAPDEAEQQGDKAAADPEANPVAGDAGPAPDDGTEPGRDSVDEGEPKAHSANTEQDASGYVGEEPEAAGSTEVTADSSQSEAGEDEATAGEEDAAADEVLDKGEEDEKWEDL